jgi:hypothetical protein
MDDALLRAMGFEPPPRRVRAAVEAALRARSRVVAKLPSRREPRLRTTRRIRSYPSGYELDQLGPEAL